MKEIKLNCIQKINNNKLLSIEYKNSLCQLHNEVDPAFICFYENGNKETEGYWINGKRHNINGPAIICFDENGKTVQEEYFLNGEYLSKKEFLKQTSKSNNPCDGKIVEIEGVKYKLSVVD